jgi:hypothetical protein
MLTLLTRASAVVFWHGFEKDPSFDPAAPAVLAAFEAAQRARRPSRDCYLAGVEAWRRAHPEQAREFASRQAVALILSTKVSLRIPDA